MILGKSETVQITDRDTKICFYLYEVPPSRVAQHVIGPRMSRSWLEHLNDVNWDVVDTDETPIWVSQDLLQTCASVEPVSELHCCQIGMTASVMGDVSAGFTLEFAHRRHFLLARALNERSLLIRGLPFPRTKTNGVVYIGDLVILSALQFSDVHVDSLHIEVQRPDAWHDVLQMPTNASKSGKYTRGRVVWRTPGWRFRHTRISFLNAEFRSCSSRCSLLRA